MLTVLLADDEEAALRSLTRNINWEELQLRFAGCVSDGQQALEYIKNTPPDILITDIAMPLLSGLELAEYIYENHIPTKVILLSGHQEFTYAQQGLRFNVTNYLVKPCAKQLLNEQLEQLASECIREKKEILEKQYFESFINNSKPMLREKLLLDLLHGNYIPSETLAEKCDFLDIPKDICYYVIAAEIDDMKESFQPLMEKQKLFTTLHMTEALSSALPSDREAIALSVAEGRFALLLPRELSDDIISLCNNIRCTFFSYTGLSTTYGIGGPAVNLASLADAYSKACETLLYKYLAGKNTVICYEDITRTTTHEKHLSNTLSLQSQMIRAVRGGDLDAIEILCEELFDTLKNCSPALIKSLIIQFIGSLSLELLDIGISLSELFGSENIVIEKVLRFETIFDVNLWLKQILKYICEHIKEKNQKSTHRLAQKAAQYMDEHYMENLNIDTIAGAVYLSSGYLMTIFKREMGISVNAYLTSKRIDRAKELLLEDNLKIYEIAQEVGYANTTFFSSTFRNQTGLSPKQYKEQHLGAGTSPLGN